MKRKSVFLMAVALVGAFVLGRAGAQEDMADMAEWMALAQPGAEHAEMKKSVGTWDVDVKMWMAPGQEPMVDKAKAVRTEELGGRFIREDYEGAMMGTPFHGVGFLGFNNATKKYEMAWMDNMGTGIMLMTGTEIEKGKTMEYKGVFYGPGGKACKSRAVVKKVSADQSTMEMFNDMGTGQEQKCMEMTYNRAK